MARRKPKIGRLIRTLTDPDTGEVVGWVYQWDNGEESRIMRTSLPAGLNAGPDLVAKAQDLRDRWDLA